MPIYQYHFRPGYGSEKLLLHFFSGVENENFLHHLLKAIEDVHPQLLNLKDVWMNDEIKLSFQSVMGGFLISKDIWDMVFIMADNNQAVFHKINALLNVDSNFEKISID